MPQIGTDETQIAPLGPPSSTGERGRRFAGEDVDVDAGEGGGLAAAAGLAGFELVKGLVELAIEVGLVADDLVEVVVRRDDGLEEAALDLFFGHGLLYRYAEGLLTVSRREIQVLKVAEGVADDGGPLIADEALVLPESEGDAPDEGCFQRPFGGQVIEQPCAIVLPFLFCLELGDDR